MIAEIEAINEITMVEEEKWGERRAKDGPPHPQNSKFMWLAEEGEVRERKQGKDSISRKRKWSVVSESRKRPHR